MSQNFNRYSYALNNPLRYTDPNGEFWQYIAGAVIGGVFNLVATWNTADGFWEHVGAFFVGAGAGVATVATGGAGFWTVAGVSAASGATVAATNDVIAQTGTNFSGMDKVNWGQVGISSGIGAASGFAGGGAGYWASNASFVVNGISSPVLRSAVVSPISSAAGHVAGGTTAGLIQGQNIGEAFTNSFDGIGTNMAIGTALGIGTTVVQSYANGVNPVNGNRIKTDVFQVTPEGVVLPKDSKYEIPNDYVESKYNSHMKNSTEYGVFNEGGKFVPKIRIDRGTPPGFKGPNESHYHLDGGSKHYTPGQSDPGFRK